MVKGGWGHRVDSKMSTEKKNVHSEKQQQPPCLSLCGCVHVCRLSLSLTHSSPLNITHPYYVSLFFIMIYMPRHVFIMIYTPVPKRAYGRYHIAEREASLYRGRNVAFSLSSDSSKL